MNEKPKGEEEKKELENLFENNNTDTNDVTTKDVEIVGRRTRSNNLAYRGILIAFISALFLSLSNVFIKKAQFFSGTEQTAIRYTLQLIVSVSIACYNGLNIFGPPEKRKMLIVRGILGTFGLTTLHLAVKFINPSDAVAIFHTNVILVAFIARFTLNEKFSLFHVIALLMAVSGVFLISQPSFLFNKQQLSMNSTMLNQSLGRNVSTPIGSATNSYMNLPLSISILIGVVFAISSACFSSGVAVLLKKLSNHKVHFSVAIVYASYFGLPFTIILSVIANLTGVERKKPELYSTWESLLWQCGYSLTSASCGVLSQILMNLSLKYEEASKISIIRTSDLFFTFILQLFILDIHPNYLSVIGALLIFVATIIVLLFKLLDRKLNRKQMRDKDSGENSQAATGLRFLFYKF